MDFFIYKIYDEDKYYCHVDKSSDTTKVFQQQKKQIKHENVFGKNGSSIVLVRQVWEKSLQGARNFLKIFEITDYDIIQDSHLGREKVVIKPVANQKSKSVSDGIIDQELSCKIKTGQITREDIKGCIDHFYNLRLFQQDADLVDQATITVEEIFALELGQEELNTKVPSSDKDMYWCNKCFSFMSIADYAKHKKSADHKLNSNLHKKSKKSKPLMVD